MKTCSKCKRTEGPNVKFGWSTRRGNDGEPRQLNRCERCHKTRMASWERTKADPERYAVAKERGSKSSSAHAKTEPGKKVRQRVHKEWYEQNKLEATLVTTFAIIVSNKPIATSKLLKLTSWQSIEQVRTTLGVRKEGDQIDHLVPRSQYDHDDPEEVKRCWSPENMRMCPKNENEKKHCSLVAELVARVPPNVWPKAWGGACPV